MRITYDPEADALAVELTAKGRSVRTQEVAPGVQLDWDKAGRLLTVEILGASAKYPRAALERLDDGTEWLTLAQAAAAGAKLGGPVATTLRVLLHTGKLTGRKEGRDWLIARHELLSYLENRSPAGRPGRRAKGPARKK